MNYALSNNYFIHEKNIYQSNNRKYIHMKKGKHTITKTTHDSLQNASFGSVILLKINLKLQGSTLTDSNHFFTAITSSYTNCSMS